MRSAYRRKRCTTVMRESKNSKSEKIVVAMSGGVDSSVTAFLLMQQGYEVIGLTAIMHPCGEQAVDDARKVCDKLGIRHETLDLQEQFKNTVIKYFEESYKKGLTPNPCTFCNRAIKWGSLQDFALKELGANFYATGHYAQIKDGKLYRGEDRQKDQSYMLYGLTQEDLSRTFFPLGELQKTQIKEIAEENGFVKAGQKESQDVCFIVPPETNSSYLINKFGEQEGDIVEFQTGKVLGRHKGIFNYTIGQRKGIRISAPEPLYVVALEPEQNKISVGYKQDLFASEFNVRDVNWQQNCTKEKISAMVKIRYNSSAQRAEVFRTGENTVHVKLDEPKDAITPGQIAVFYDLENQYILGGGVISSALIDYSYADDFSA